MNAKQIWQSTIERLQTKMQPAVFSTWFLRTSAHAFEDGVFVVAVPTTFAKAHLEGRFVDVIRPILAEVVGGPVELQFVVAKETSHQKDNSAEEPADSPASPAPAANKRPYRLPKNRPTVLQREQRPSIIDKLEEQQPLPPTLARNSLAINTPALNTLAPPITRSNVHRSANAETGDHSTTGTDETQMIRETREQHHQPSIVFAQSPYNGEGLLIPRYTFNTFIVGKSNQLAHAASLAVSENPGRIYNPLFFYGGVGLGKTHLLHAVGHIGELAGLNVLYVTSEKFTNEIVNAIRYQKTEEFRTKYRQIDILLVDDIQFIAGKESTEEEFFHTFNTLYDANKQIIVTSDRPPKAIHSLQDRLRSRFEWGLLADLQAPEYEHRLAILRSKADSLRFSIPSSVIDYIARPECKSVRELEGSLNRVIAYATLNDAPLSISLAVKALEHIYTDSKKTLTTLTISEILAGVCRYYNVDLERLKGKQRDRDIAWPRQVAMYVMREEANSSLFQIGHELGGRDHTTIIHGCEKVHTEMMANDRVRREIAALLDTLRQR